MQNFRIYSEPYEPPKPEPKYRYSIGSFVVFVKDLSESVNLKVRTV